MDELELLREEALHFGIALSDPQLHRFRVYLDELWEWNSRINLIGMDTRKRVVMELFLDSLMPAPYLPDNGKMLDVGSGAGFPGIPLKIFLPDYALHIVEPKAKRVGFLRQAIRLLGLERALVVHGRIEESGPALFSTGYDVVTAKALAPLGRTITLCAPSVAAGGLLVCFLGTELDEVLKSAEREVGENGLALFKQVPYQIPGKRSRRWICFFLKES
ncbi:16S rRNA (guanine(527)-N(7))-methyltransferase RsmG [Thermodesulfobacteriota bacterium]